MDKRYSLILFVLLISFTALTQSRVAILDFENTSGVVKYDGFGKAISNMLITDLKNNIHPRKVIFLERLQLNKIFTEQGLQKSKDFDKETAVRFGKLAGVNFVIVGSVYVLNNSCNITSRMVNVETSEIVYSKEVNGKIVEWLKLKSVLADKLSEALNNPIDINDAFSNGETSAQVITMYSKVLDKMDEGEIDEAEQMAGMLSELQPDFKYFDEIKSDIDQIKKEIERLKNRVSDTEIKIKSLSEAFRNSDNLYFFNPTNKMEYLSNAVVDNRKGRYMNAINNFEIYFSFQDSYIDPYLDFIQIISLPEYKSYKTKFLNSFSNSKSLNENIAAVLMLNEKDKRIYGLNSLLQQNKDNILVNYFLVKEKLNDINITGRLPSCDEIKIFMKIEKSYNKVYNSKEFYSSFIDKIKIKQDVERELTTATELANFLDGPIKALEKLGYGIGYMSYSLKRVYSCSDKDAEEAIKRYYKLNNISGDISFDKLIGKYYRVEGDGKIKSECVDFVSKDKMKWTKDSIESTYSYKLVKNNIVGQYDMINMPFDFIIIDENTVKYLDGMQGVLFKK